MCSQFLAPRLLQLANSHAVAHGQACRLVGSDGEETEPLCDVIFPEQRQALDVPLPISREDDTDRRHERGGQSPPSEDDLNQCSSRYAVSVIERVDGLELRMCDRRLDEGREPFVVARRREVREATRGDMRWRRHEVMSC